MTTSLNTIDMYDQFARMRHLFYQNLLLKISITIGSVDFKSPDVKTYNYHIQIQFNITLAQRGKIFCYY